MSANAWISALGGTRIPLELETTDDDFAVAVIRHEYPGVHGADLENQGQSARTVRLRCIFWDQPAFLAYDNHFALLALLTETARLELNHPVYGLLTGEVEQVSVRHDDSDRYCEVDISFVEQLRGATRAVQVVDILSATESGYQAVLENEASRLADAARNDIGSSAAAEILDTTLDPEAGILEQFTGVSRAAWGYVVRVNSLVTTLEGTLLDIAIPPNSLVSTIDFATDLPGRVIGSLARCVERYAVLNERLDSAPTRFIDSFRAGIRGMESAVEEFAGHLHAIASTRGALALARTFRADDDRRRANRSATAPSFDAAGNRVPLPPREQVLTVREMEDSVALSRAWLQQAIDLDRSRVELKSAGRDLVSHLTGLKIRSEDLTTIRLDQPLPLHLVCLAHGLPYNDAERLLAVNRIRRPNFTSGEVQVYVR